MGTVLIADASGPDRLLLETMVGRMGHHPLVAGSGAEGLGALRSHPVDAVLCGDALPDMSSGDFRLQAARDPRSAGTPFLLLSREASERSRDAALAAGFSGVVHHPPGARELFLQMENCWPERRRAHLRVPLSFPVRVRGLPTGAREVLETGSFGEGGMFLASARPFPRDQRLEVEFELPRQDRTFRATCRVRYAAAGGVGVAFEGLEETARAVFGIFLENHLARSGAA